MPNSTVPLRCLVVDDDPLSIQIVENCIANTPFLVSTGTCDSAIAAAEVLRVQPVDLLFLDVEMPLMSGIDLLRTLQHPPLVVLITSSQSYAVQAFEQSVVDYLVKPVSYARFLQAAQKALELAESRLTPATAPTEADADFTFVKVDTRLVKVLFDEVRYVEALGDYVHIVTGQSKLIVYSTMKAVEEKFPTALFARVHRSFIVNIKRVQAIEDNTIIIENKHIPIGQTYLRDVLQRLNKF
ncbi:two component transcriptional regulator, LytTR family [Hymenobacter daecheongensis DSM 21074]|uniref:Two component transcriptional regulator, LytTR family n=1 Tax=Hymenobacter daecheongensis DSM 21074 TaxID=1121955 RepID=A0A1M6CVT1_9BACT|nr:LytTR family DNA-binding domain-containing protein [Hymenobacter daecheongensis]SHI65185.1 two component transcriptional regulator, LytTR family [Hymenobacter daecheongensis DSM 21074]